MSSYILHITQAPNNRYCRNCRDCNSIHTIHSDISQQSQLLQFMMFSCGVDVDLNGMNQGTAVDKAKTGERNWKQRQV